MKTQQLLSLSRRDFLRTSVGAGTAAALFSMSSTRALCTPPTSMGKVVVITFGGGARDDETFSLNGQRNIPHLLEELAPQSCFFTQVVNRGILGHYVATASIATGVYETFDNFVEQSPEHPTAFEYFRRDRRRPREDAWVIAPSAGFAQMGSSQNKLYGPEKGAEVVLPKQLLASVLGPSSPGQERGIDTLDLLRDSYERPSAQRAPGPTAAESDHLLARLKMDPKELRAQALTLASPDELSVYFAKHVMRQFAPSLLFLTLHDIDIAHSGAFSLYLEGIQRTDRLCSEIWREIQSNPEYKDKTTLMILPDFGRDGDGEPGGNGFQHHRTGGAEARTTWLMALGPGVRQKTVVDRAIEPIDVVPTIGGLLGFDAAQSQGKRIVELR
jgi:hypothetical protein